VPLPTFLATYLPAYFGPGWDDVLVGMLSAESERETVEALRAELSVNGRFNEPVAVESDDKVADGMHRIVASILAGATHISVTDADVPATPAERVEVRFTADLSPELATKYDSATWFAAAHLRSFPLEGRWTETASMVSTDGVVSGSWFCPHGLADKLAATLVARAARFGAALTVLSATAAIDHDD
jgi:hypothetical protein